MNDQELDEVRAERDRYRDVLLGIADRSGDITALDRDSARRVLGMGAFVPHGEPGHDCLLRWDGP